MVASALEELNAVTSRQGLQAVAERIKRDQLSRKSYTLNSDLMEHLRKVFRDKLSSLNHCSHMDTTQWVESRSATRHGWLTTYCQACGGFVGHRYPRTIRARAREKTDKMLSEELFYE